MTRFAKAAAFLAALACVALLSPAPALAGAAMSRARAAEPDAWAKNTKILEGAGEDAACSGLTKAIHARVATIQALAAALEKDREKPARNLAGWVHTMMGGHYTSEATKRKHEAIVKERQTADELNRLLATVDCPEVDVGAELAKLPVPAQ